MKSEKEQAIYDACLAKLASAESRLRLARKFSVAVLLAYFAGSTAIFFGGDADGFQRFGSLAVAAGIVVFAVLRHLQGLEDLALERVRSFQQVRFVYRMAEGDHKADLTSELSSSSRLVSWAESEHSERSFFVGVLETSLVFLGTLQWGYGDALFCRLRDCA